MSQHRLGVIQNNQGGAALFSSATLFGGTVPGASDVLVKYTYFGDSNFDGKVDGSDYSRIDNGFNQHLTGWFNGDFNYDGVVDGSDYTLIDNAFNTQGAPQPAAMFASTQTQVVTRRRNSATAESEVATTEFLPNTAQSNRGAADVLDALNVDQKRKRRA